MEIQYIRKLTSSHMVVEQLGTLSEWEERMIAHAAAEHLLFGECVRENERTDLWYDITGKQSLDVILETNKLKYDFLCELLLELCGAVEAVEGILLDPDGILILPECMFRDYRTGRLFFCYYPGNTNKLPEAFGQLLEYLLARLDHGDERAVTLAYGVYERFAKGWEGFSALKELLRIPYEPEQTGEEPGGRGAEEVWKEEQREELQERESGETFPPEKGLPEIRQRREVSFGRPAEGRKPGRRRLSIPAFGEILERCGLVTQSRPPVKKDSAEKTRKRRRREIKEETFVFEPEEEEEELPQARPTVLLGGTAVRPEGILRYEGRGACGDLVISGETYVIGSEAGCDGYIPSTTVSRKHARITRKEEIYFIEDLNSSNGTSVGGELLSYKTKMSLQKNEIVMFADEKFRFV